MLNFWKQGISVLWLHSEKCKSPYVNHYCNCNSYLAKVMIEMMPKMSWRPMKAIWIPHRITSTRKTYVCHRSKKRAPNRAGMLSTTEITTPTICSVKLPFFPEIQSKLLSLNAYAVKGTQWVPACVVPIPVCPNTDVSLYLSFCTYASLYLCVPVLMCPPTYT